MLQTIGKAIGAIVIGVIILLVGYHVFGIGQSPQIPDTTPPEQTSVEPPDTTPPEQTSVEPPDQTAYPITPKDIFANINNVPPAQRDLVAENYKGIRVSWKVSLTNVFPQDGKLRIYARDEDRYSVCAEIDRNQHPVFNIMDEGTSFIIDGEIYDIGTVLENIELTNCEFHY